MKDKRYIRTHKCLHINARMYAVLNCKQSDGLNNGKLAASYGTVFRC